MTDPTIAGEPARVGYIANRLWGMAVVIDRYLCMQTFMRWRKSHRKARINRKWHKRYGAVTKCSNAEKCWQVGGRIVCCPCALPNLERVIKEANES